MRAGIRARFLAITGCRSNRGRWLCVVLALALLPLTLWSMVESIWGAAPCVVLLSLLVLQFFRPSLLGWSALLVLFSAYGITMAAHATMDDYMFAAIYGFVPVAGLLFV